jgi:type IV pilus assembly protein PilY1
MSRARSTRRAGTVVRALLVWLLVASPLAAGAIELADAPVFLLKGVPPNLVLTLDDSGQMGAGYLPESLASVDDYPAILLTRRAASSDFNTFYYNPKERYSPAVNADGKPLRGTDGNANFNDAWRDVFTTDGGCQVDLAHHYVAVWQETTPPCLADDTLSNVYMVDPLNPAYLALTPLTDAGAFAKTWAARCLSGEYDCPAYYYVYDPQNGGCDGNKETDACYTRVVVGTEADLTRGGFEDAPAARQNFANWFAYYRTRLRLAQTVLSHGTQGLDGKVRFSYQDLPPSIQTLTNHFGSFSSGAADFYSWLFSLKPAGDAPLIQAVVDAGEFLSTDLPYRENVEDPDSELRACRSNFHLLVSDGAWDDTWASGNTDAQSVDFPTNPFAVTSYDPRASYAAPYVDDNVGFLADAAFYYWSRDLRPNLDNVVPPLVGHSADTADTFWRLGNDPATWQHVTTYALGVGQQGNVVYPDGTYSDGQKSIFADGFPGSYDALSTPAASIPSSAKADDLWHAAINGRGSFSNAQAPDLLTDALRGILSSVATVGAASASAAASSPGTSTSGPRIFQALLNTLDWSGEVRAFDISLGLGQEPCATVAAGEPCGTPAWEAAARVDASAAAGSRQIITVSSSGTGIAFTAANWDQLSSGQQQGLLGPGIDPIEATDAQQAKAKARIDYLRGVRNYEASRRSPSDPYTFRDRSTVLGDIINAGPVYVGAPNRYYTDHGYSQGDGDTAGFKEQYQNRTGVVYVGANDGMLHAFNAQTGDELFAYVPSLVFSNLADLTDPRYGGNVSHKAFVDGPIGEGDAYFNGAWHSVLVGALGRGAQGIYALDVTDPAAVEQASPGTLPLWELLDRADADLGFVYGRPAIVRIPDPVNTGEIRWVAIFGNGYNNTDTAGESPDYCFDQDSTTPCTISATGDAVLYLVDIADRTIVKKLDTGVGRANDPTTTVDADKRANGLAQVTVIDADGDLVADFAYAGDLFGNLWKFNLSDLTATPKRIFVAKDAGGKVQPITTPIAVARYPTGVGTLVLFGTGKFLGQEDVADLQVQTFYGIWDYGQAADSGPNRGDLLQQSFIASASIQDNGVTVSEARVTTSNAIDWNVNKGWYIDLCPGGGLGHCATQKGERVAVAPVVKADRVVFVTVIPESDPCSAGGVSWVNALSTDSGARLATTPFDFNGDGVFGVSDLASVHLDDEQVLLPGSSIRMLSAPGVYSSPATPSVHAGLEGSLVSTSGGQLASFRESSALSWSVWREGQ